MASSWLQGLSVLVSCEWNQMCQTQLPWKTTTTTLTEKKSSCIKMSLSSLRKSEANLHFFFTIQIYTISLRATAQSKCSKVIWLRLHSSNDFIHNRLNESVVKSFSFTKSLWTSSKINGSSNSILFFCFSF